MTKIQPREIHVDGESTFNNCTLYTMEAFGANRVDCKWIVVKYKQKYAQYNDAIRVEYLEKGKRKPRARMLISNKYLMIVDTKDAIKVPDCMDHYEGGKQTRYATFDERWLTDWQVQSKDMPVLLQIELGHKSC